MLTACWSVKGGSGTTVVAASLTLALARAGRQVIAADFGGDLPVALGLACPQGPGLRDWVAAGVDVPADALERIAVHDASGITVVPRGDAPCASADPTAATRLVDALRALPPVAPIVADCGTAADPVAQAFVAAADRSLLVMRPCYLAMRRAVAAPRPSGVVLVNEVGRALSASDIEDVLGVPVVAVIDWDPAVAKAVDCGMLQSTLPRRVQHALRGVAA